MIIEAVTVSPVAAALGAALAAVAASYLATGLVLRLLRRWSILDHPNIRSSHRQPTPRGGGLAVVPVVLVAWLAIALCDTSAVVGHYSVLVAAAVLAAVSWLDDMKGLPASLRLGVQCVAVTAVIVAVPQDGAFIAGWLPPAVDRALAALLWIWFINVFNFMDGIDGLAASEAICVGSGVAVVALIAGLSGSIAAQGLLVAAATLGFLPWNWHRAHVFLGDVGSVPLGFLLGWLLLQLVAQGQPGPALILPLYFLTDASLTLTRRILRGEKAWEAHREHYYQRAVAGGLTHSTVTGCVLLANLLLLGLAVIAGAGHPLAGVAGAGLVVATLLMFLATAHRPAKGG